MRQPAREPSATPRAGGWLVRAGLAVAVAVVPAVFWPRIYDNFTLPKQSALFLAAALVLTGLAVSGHRPAVARATRLALVGYGAWMLLCTAAGLDPLGALLGTYQYRQGLLTELAYLVIVLGAAEVGRDGGWRWLVYPGAAGLGLATGYGVMQVAGLDPVHWWVPTSERAIGTVGNANELASYAVAALSLCALLLAGGRRERAVAAGIALAASVAVLVSGSRSGIVALAVFFLVLLAIRLLAAHRSWRRGPVLPLVGGAAAAILAAAALGTSSGWTRLLQTGDDAGAATRAALLQGTLAAIEASPVTGFGPAGLPIAFPRFRPADLGGYFEQQDLVVQSSHNWPLDAAAAGGLVGLGLLLLLLGALARDAMAAARSDGLEAGVLLAGLMAYGLVTFLNPLSLPAQVLLFALLGYLVGRAEVLQPATRERSPPPPVTGRAAARALRATAAAGALALLSLAVLLPMADARAQRGWNAYAAGRFPEAAEEYAAAASLMPLERDYLAREAAAWLADGGDGDRASYAAARRALQRLEARFPLTSDEHLLLAAAAIGLGETGPAFEMALAAAKSLNPHGVSVDSYLYDLERAALGRWRLAYSGLDPWGAASPTPGPREFAQDALPLGP